MKTIVCVNASHPQDTPAGRILYRMYYGDFLAQALVRNEYSGFPHNGGEHTLRLRMAPPDLKAFLELVEERFAPHPGAAEFCESVRKRFEHKYPRLARS
ncbi:hypothetical protein [Burkholderia gladioli]|uniref:hypothetical protein n=1 Tax=Burkholderia gladioli TaxID=28095 RepID=UPI001640CBBC|nr:hypothetical protein [Burkholderia gladioli]